MAVRIRLRRMGRKKRPFYRIVVADSRSPRDGRYIESVGFYNPVEHPPEVRVDEERAGYWLDQGAIPSDTVKSILQQQGVLFKRSMVKKGVPEAQIEEEMKKWEVLQIERQRRAEEKSEAKKKAKAEKKEAEEKAEAAAEAPASDTKSEAKAEAKPEEKAEPEAKEAAEAAAEAPASDAKSEAKAEAKPEELPELALHLPGFSWSALS